MIYKLKLIFKDRIGIVAEISALIAEQAFNIVAMEVIRAEDCAHLYLEIENQGEFIQRQVLFEVLGNIADLIEIRFIDTLPQEERENRFRVVLDNISDGVLSIDHRGNITTINQMARLATNSQDQAILGKNLKTLQLPDYSLLECLTGERYSNVKKNLITATGRYEYLATGRPIRDSAGRIIGAVEIAKGVREIKALARSITDPGQINFSDIVGQNPALVEAIAFAQKIAGTDAIISLHGASGTGKECFARAIHNASGRRGVFVPINCAALPENLLESELFGYAGGSFTGSRREGRAGLFETAKDGTVFLDEIAELPWNSQAKILRVIQEKRVRRIGDTKELPVNARIVTATNRRLEQLIDKKLFRQDLYYRINVLPIHLPPLAERTDDIPLLVEHFLFRLASKLDKAFQSISTSALEKLKQHHWPGNVRELKNVVERAAILSESERIEVDSILFSHEITGKKNSVLKPHQANTVGGNKLALQVAEFEKRIIRAALQETPSIRSAARNLGISHTALLNKMKKHKLKMELNRTTGNI